MYKIELKNDENFPKDVKLNVIKQVSDAITSSNIQNHIPDNSIIEISVDPTTFSGIRINDFLSIDLNGLIDGDFLKERLYAFQIALTRIMCTISEERKPIAIRIYSTDPTKNLSNAISDDKDVHNSQMFKATDPKYNLKDIILTDRTKEQINRAIALIQNQTKIYKEWGFEKIDPYTKTILCFYGKPGTGKTMCAHGLASALGKKLIIASYASIESKWVGEGPKNLKRIFKDSIEQDAILFFDEADSFLSKRIGSTDTGSDKHYNRMSNEMFQLLENHNGIVIFATNMVSDFDKAFKSRILAFIELELPNRDTRAKIIRSMILPTIPLVVPLSEQEIMQLSDILDGFSGRDIRKAILTTLSDGAMRNASEFTYSDFEKSFTSIKEDTDNIEKNMTGNNPINNVVSDFIRQTDENSAIFDICLNTVLQTNNIATASKKEFQSICKSLNIDMPDLSTISYAKDIILPAEILIGTDRVKECLQYCCNILATNKEEDAKNESYINQLIDALCFNNKDIIYGYYKATKALKS